MSTATAHRGSSTLRLADSSATSRDRGLIGLIQGFATDPNSVLERQICTASVFFLSLPFLLIPGIDVTQPGMIVAACGLTIAATIGAFVLRQPHIPPRASMIIPLVGILAVGCLRAGTGGTASIFTIMMALPVISLGVEPGRLPMLLGGPVTIIALFLPVIHDPHTLDNGQWSRLIYVPIIMGLICLSANELTRRLRSKVRAVKQLQREQEQLLAAAQDHADITAAASTLLRESTNQLASVIDAVTEQSIIATDRTGRIEVFNAGAQKMLRVAAHDAIGRSITAFHVSAELVVDDSVGEPGRPVSPFSALVAGVRAGAPRLADWTYVARDGHEIRVQVAVTSRTDAGNEIDGFLFVATDVTQDREQARMKDEFVNLISHELRTPLSSILGYLELVIDDDDNPLSAEQIKYLGTIERNANRLLRLVSDLLFTAQVEAGRFQLVEQEVDLRRLVSASLDTARPTADARNIRLQLSATDQVLAVWGDPMRLGQAIDNLISNAVKFTPTGGRVAVTIGTLGEHDERASISVSDTGVGIPAEEIDRLFSRFFRASTATKNAVPGVGLGLTITKAIAVAHGGRIGVASTVGEGTTFTLDLPRLAGPAELERDSALPAETESLAG